MLALALLVACDGKSPTDDSSAPEPEPILALSAEALDFGALPLDGRATAELPLTLSNAGGGVLLLESLAFTLGEDSPFSVETPSTYTLTAGQSTALTLSFQPRAPGSAADALHIHSTDPLNPEVAVALTGAGDGPAIGVDPADSADLGAVLLGCERTQDLVIGNTGTTELSVTAVQLSGDLAFTLDLMPSINGALPWALDPDATRTVRVTYAPSEAVAQSATLRINSSDALSPAVEVALSASGASFGALEDTFTAEARMDVVFAVDTTTVTQAPLNQLQDDITLLTDALRREGADAQISAVVADDGCIVGGLVAFNPSMAADDQRRAFVAMTSASPGALAQQPFNLLSAAIDGDAGCNAGLFRPDAVAAFVGFSARDDQSGDSARVSVEGLQAQLSRPSRLVFSAIAGDLPSGCGSATSATTLDQAVTLSGGVFSSICASNYRSALEDIADAAITRSLASYRLSAAPVETSLHVELRGVERESGWSYNEEERAIFFDETANPNPGDGVVVRYEARAEQCD